jgi:hypothetical protein
VGRSVFARQRRELQVRYVDEDIIEGHLGLRKLHQHPASERARGHPLHTGSALEVLHNPACQHRVAVQPSDRDARACHPPVSFPERRRWGRCSDLLIRLGCRL